MSFNFYLAHQCVRRECFRMTGFTGTLIQRLIGSKGSKGKRDTRDNNTHATQNRSIRLHHQLWRLRPCWDCLLPKLLQVDGCIVRQLLSQLRPAPLARDAKDPWHLGHPFARDSHPIPSARHLRPNATNLHERVGVASQGLHSQAQGDARSGLDLRR